MTSAHGYIVDMIEVCSGLAHEAEYGDIYRCTSNPSAGRTQGSNGRVCDSGV